jgi:hypothetical protein
MKKEIEIGAAEKLKLLQSHSMGLLWESLGDTKWCLQCDSKFTGHSAHVYQDRRGECWLKCGNPKCCGTPVYWANYPWWNPAHPETKKEQVEIEQVREDRRKGRFRR